MKTILLGILVTCGCGTYNPYDRNHYQDVVNYPTSFDSVTPDGIRVDTSGQDISLVDIDSHISKVESCLRNLYPDGKLPESLIAKAQCQYKWFEPTIDRTSIAVKVAADWHWSGEMCGDVGYGRQQIFPCNVDKKLCEVKGLTVTADCPCECRGSVLQQHVVVTTPNLHLFDNDLIRIVVGCNFIWTPGLQECFSG